MKKTFFIYDLETTGINPRDSRIMQFAGVRTDLDLNPVEEPHNYLVRITDDVLPEPEAILITGITPQQTIADGYTEAEFLKIFYNEIARPGTIFMGYNTVRFDDEFMRYLHYRNFYDPYEWQYKDERSRWDLLDVVRMTRALRPEGINWPVDSKGTPTNRLELLTSLNGLEHSNAHDALSDVQAVIGLASIIRAKQPKLFDFLLSMREKRKVAALVDSGQPFVYSSGKYANEFEKTTVVAKLADLSIGQGSFVFDLRYDPEPFLKLDPPALAEAWRKLKDEPGPRLPVKSIKYNRCPAIAPLSVLDEDSQARLKLSPKVIKNNFEVLQRIQAELSRNVVAAAEILDKKTQTKFLQDESDVDARLYDGFFDHVDKNKMSVVRAASAEELKNLDVSFKDDRLESLFPLYKARNYPKTLTDAEREAWERFREQKLTSGGKSSRLAKYLLRLQEMQARTDLSEEKRYLLEELNLYAQSIFPGELG